MALWVVLLALGVGLAVYGLIRCYLVIAEVFTMCRNHGAKL